MLKCGDVVTIIFLDEPGVQLVIDENSLVISILTCDGSIVRMTRKDAIRWINEGRIIVV